MSNKHNLRFAVTDGRNKASTWSLVAYRNKPEVYIYNRLLSTIHVSFHASGKWHIKFGDIEEKKRVSIGQVVEDAYMTKWERPSPTKPSVTVAFRIITPWGALQKPKFTETKQYVPVANAQPGNSTEILILFVEADKQLDIKNATLIGSLTLSNGEQVVVVSTEISATTRQTTGPANIPDISERISLLSLFQGNLGMILFGDASDGSRVMWEYAIKVTPKAYVMITVKKLKRLINTYVKRRRTRGDD